MTISKKSKIHLFFYAAILFVLLLIMLSALQVLAPQHKGLTLKLSIHAWSFLSFLLVAHIISGLGVVVMRILRIKPDNDIRQSPSFILAFGTGAVALAMISFLLASLKVFNFGYRLLPMFLFIALLPFNYVFYRKINTFLLRDKSPDEKKRFILNIICLMILLPVIGISVICFAPPVGWDSQTYHLLIPKKMIESHGFVYIPLNIYSNMPFNMNLLYAFAMGTGNETTSRLLAGFISFMIIPLFIKFSGRIFKTDIHSGIISALIFFSSPIVLSGTVETMIDVQMAFFGILAIYLMFEWMDKHENSLLILTAAVCGFLSGGKYTGFYIPAALFTASLFTCNFRVLKNTIIIPVLCMLFLLPWMIKSYIYTGNPVYPMMYDLFGGRDWSGLMYEMLTDWQNTAGMGRNFTDYLLLPSRVFFISSEGYRNFAGKVSVTPMLFLLFSFMSFFKVKEYQKKILYLLIASFVSFYLWGYGPQQVRFLIPGLAIICLTGGVGFVLSMKNNSRKNSVIALIYVMLFVVTAVSAKGMYSQISFASGYLFGREQKEQYLERHVWAYPAFQYIEKNISDDKNVLFIFENMGYYYNGKYFADGMYEASYLIDLALQTGNADDFADGVRNRFAPEYVLVNNNIRDMIQSGIDNPGNAIFSKPENMDKYKKGFNIIKEFLDKNTEIVFEKNKVAVCKIKPIQSH